MSVPVVGFDVGSLTSYVCIAKGGGIEAVTNEYSDRCTPSCVAFTSDSRAIGYAAQQQLITNLGNTVINFSRLVGKRASDTSLLFERTFLPYETVNQEDGRIAIKLRTSAGNVTYLPEQVYAMHLRKLVEIAEANLDAKVVDVVLNVPAYFSDAERRSVMDACRIARLNCIRLVNDTTAAALVYGFYNTKLPAVEKPPMRVVFVSFGNSCLQVSITAFNAGRMQVLSSACEPCVGARDFDMELLKHFAAEFKETYKIDVFKSKKAFWRLMQQCEKLKKVMSANTTEIPINVECLMDDKDVTARMKRELFENLCSNLLEKVKSTFQRSLLLAKLEQSDIDSVELIGGGTRIPAVKKLILEIFGKEGKTTLNADEAVARGCALQAAICSPGLKVREFTIIDANYYDIKLLWSAGEAPCSEAVESEKEAVKSTSMVVYEKLSPFPKSKHLSFTRSGDFNLRVHYIDQRSPTNEILLGDYNIEGVTPLSGSETCDVRVKVRVNQNGIFTIAQAELVERYEKETVVKEAKPAPKEAAKDSKGPVEHSPDGDIEPSPEGQPSDEAATANSPTDNCTTPDKKKTIMKKCVRYHEIPVKATTNQFSEDEIMNFAETETNLLQRDKLERKRKNAQNAVEEYVYDMRSKLEGPLRDFMSDPERADFSQKLTLTEDWLYDDGANEICSAYETKLNQLKNDGDVFEMRALEAEQRPAAVDRLRRLCMRIEKAVSSYRNGEPTYDHLPEAEIENIQSESETKSTWLESKLAQQMTTKKFENPLLRVNDIDKESKLLESMCNSILSKPKPQKAPENPNNADGSEEKTADAPAKDVSDAPSPKQTQMESDQVEIPMDIP